MLFDFGSFPIGNRILDESRQHFNGWMLRRRHFGPRPRQVGLCDQNPSIMTQNVALKH